MPDIADPGVSEPALHDPLPDPYASLSSEQRAAVEHDVGASMPQPLRVVAGADPQRIFGTSAQDWRDAWPVSASSS